MSSKQKQVKKIGERTALSLTAGALAVLRQCGRVALLLLVMVLTTATAGATTFIKDVKLIGGTSDECNALKESLIADGWTFIDYDLNEGAEGDFIYLLYKAEESPDGYNLGYITDFYIHKGKNPPSNLDYNGRKYYKASYDGGSWFKDHYGDLNSHSSGDYIYLYYTKAFFPDNRAVTGITFNDTPEKAVGLEGGSEGYDLNSGAGGDYIYMHFTTGTVLPCVLLTSETGDVTLQDGDVLIGTGGENTHVTIADDATVTLHGVTINNINWFYNEWAGITCEGDATIVLADGTSNTVKGGFAKYPGIKAGPAGTTLTIRGTGRLYVRPQYEPSRPEYDGGPGAGIGCEDGGSCGNIVIEEGDITAIGSDEAAAIGAARNGSCGDITIGRNARIHASVELAMLNPSVWPKLRYVMGPSDGVSPGTGGTLTICGIETNYIGLTDNPFIYPYTGNGTSDDPYIIYNRFGWRKATLDVAEGINADKCFKQDRDFTVGYMMGDASHPFSGTYDGDAHKLTVDYSTDAALTAPFRYVSGATIKNLKTSGTIATSGKFASGLVGCSEGSTSIINCVNNVTINSSVMGDGTHGGFIAMVNNGTASITGCKFGGKMLGANTTLCGGFVGWAESNNNATVGITDCMFMPTELTAGGGKTFARARDMSSVTVKNSYYTECLGEAQGKRLRHISVLDDHVSIIGTETAYSFSNLTAIGSTILRDGSTLCSGKGQTISLDVTIPNDYGFNGFLVNDEPINGSEFIMPDADAAIKPVWLLELADGMAYDMPSYESHVNINYTKNFVADCVGKHHAWLLPFDYTIKADDVEKFTFYKINMIANSPSPSVEASDEMWVFLTRLNAGDVLHANMPYVCKPKQTMSNCEFTVLDATLKAKNTDILLDTRTTEDIYSFYATYENTTATAADPFYYVGIDGNVSYGDAVTVGPYRWIIRKTSKFGGKPKYARQMHFYDGEGETTGIISLTPAPSPVREGSDEWYTLDGRRLAGKPKQSGVYVNNGKKIVIK